MTGRELRERHEAYAQASGPEAAWDLLAGSIEADLCERVAQVVARREGDEAAQARRAQTFDPEG